MSYILHANIVAVCRHWDEAERRRNETSRKADDGQGKAGNVHRQEAQAGDQSVAANLQRGSRELARLRDAVK